MKRRSGTGGKAIKGQHRKALKPTRRDARKVAVSSNSSPSGRETEVARLTCDLRDALEQQVATSEVLQVISGSAGDLQPVFAAMLENAVRICDATFGIIYRWDGEFLHALASHKTPTALAEARRRRPIRPRPDMVRTVTTKSVVHIPDLAAHAAYTKDRDPALVSAVELGGVRTFLIVPMFKGTEFIGSFSLYRQEVRPFTDKQIALVTNFAAQAVIAIENARLVNELRQRTTDLTEALEQQTASSDVLRVISSSPGDVKPVFDAMLASATRICDATFGAMLLRDGDAYRRVALHNAPQKFFEYSNKTPILRPGMAPGVDQVIHTRQVVHIPDLEAENPNEPIVKFGGARTILGVPMLKENEAIGVIGIYRQEVRPFGDEQIKLVQNFAAQAVIAIENARLLNELRQRTTDLTEALEQQTATSDVLQVISSSPGDLQPVFASMLENAVRICDATFGNIYRYDGEALHIVATHNTPPAFAEDRRRSPYRPYPQSPIGHMVAAKTVVHISDVTAEDVYKAQHDPVAVSAVELGGIRTLLGVPLLNKGEMIGAFFLSRQEVRLFTDKQIELVTNFAAQAVIAIENARLLNELRQRTDDLTEALQQQTATSEVLKTISASPSDLQPVFANLLENAVRICEASFGVLPLYEGEHFRVVAMHNAPLAYAELRRRQPVFRTERMMRLATSRQPFQVADLLADDYRDNSFDASAFAELSGARTILAVPLLKEDQLVGAIVIYRREVRLFSQKQVELIENFAAQAVIAIENARLLNELRQSLEQQTATSQVLQVISSSPGNLKEVFATILENATRICEAKFGALYLNEGDGFRATAMHNAPPAYEEARAGVVHPPPSTTLWRAANTKQAVQIADVMLERGYIEGDPFNVSAVALGGYRSVFSVPMLHEDKLVGVITIFRQAVRPFTEEQISLVQNFAAQAVIAMENARLLNELRERTQQLEAQSQEVVELNQQLEQRVADQVGEIERMSRLRRFLPPQVADLIVASGTEKQLESHRREVTALFCDLRGFTGFSESADPEDVMTLLREYHEAIGESIIKYSGTLERYAGDGVMVVFNDPVPVENPALQAVLMALEMRDAIAALTETWRRWGHDIGFGIGIAHGFATLGTIGFEGRFDYAAIGTVSNVASRLCDEAKPGQILISPRVLTKVENAVTVEPVGEFALKGIRRPLAAYNVRAAQSSDT